MAGVAHGLPIPTVEGARILVIEARFHAHINDLLIAGTTAMLEKGGAVAEILSVPGALEIPAAIRMAAESARFDGYVALGCVIRGETTHYDLVANESCRGLMALGTDRALAIGNGILTVENEQQALVRADPAQMDKGGHAALAAMVLIDWRRQLT